LLIRHTIDDANFWRTDSLINAGLVNVTTILRATILTTLTWTIKTAT
jgi:hypothetical protein